MEDDVLAILKEKENDIADKRISPRLQENNEVTIKVISNTENLPEEERIRSYSEDISATGTKIKTNMLLNVNALLMVDFTLNTLQQKLYAIGKVKWVKVLIEDESYEAGVEFINAPISAIQRIEDYISWKQKRANNKPIRISAEFDKPKSK